MAVTGRQRLYVYLASQQAIWASASAMLSRANRRASWTRLSPRSAATPSAILFQYPMANAVPSPSFQNLAICVCSSVRVVLLARPRSLTSLKAAAYAALSSAGGGAGRNCEPADKANGVTYGHCGASAGRLAGGVGCQSPGSLPGV